ncbi:MAG TPA: hypothetical protein VF085_07930 [Solirubrobacterales bacterium]
MRRAVALLALLGVCVVAPTAEGAEWRSQQPVTGGIGVPVPLGEVGDVEFWAPNRGMLITAGNDGVPAGLFAYDGTGWYRYSTVCGGHEGRIAWAGPGEFWTISDQQIGQETGAPPARHISLCHFKDGQVVASYGEPLGLSSSYLPMSAAACAGPDDCWFGGERLSGDVNEGAFHLHWDGGSLTARPSLTEPEPEVGDPGRSVVSLVRYGGRFYESVAVREGDVAPGEPASQPFFLHQIVPSTSPFAPLPVHGMIEYGDAGAIPEELEGFQLSADDGEMWAISGALSAPAKVVVLRKPGSQPFAPVSLVDPGNVLGTGDGVGGVGAEPGGDAWVGFRRPGEFESAGPARLTRIHVDGTVDAETVLPSAGEGIGDKGTAGPIACPAAGQCWMATSRGWLFHRGPDLPQDTDPALHVLVTFRPRDDSLPVIAPDSLPEDDSGAFQAPEEEPLRAGEAEPLPRRVPALLSKLHQRIIGGDLLELTFVLRRRAHVQLIARREGQVVAQTPRYTMGKGSQSVRLRLDPKRWPTKLDLQVHAVKQKGGGK